MKAANLLPSDGGRRGPKVKLRPGSFPPRQREPKQPHRPREARQRPATTSSPGPLLIVAAVMFAVLIIAAAAVLEHNDVNNHNATLAAVNGQVAAEQARTAKLDSHGQVITKEQQESAAIQSITGSRFNWYSALTGFGEAITPHTYFTSLSYNGATSTSTTTTTGAATGPVFTLGGCTGSQRELADVLRELRRIHGVVSVSESTGAGGVQLSNSSRSSTSRNARDGYPSSCSDTFSMAIAFASPTAGNRGR